MSYQKRMADLNSLRAQSIQEGKSNSKCFSDLNGSGANSGGGGTPLFTIEATAEVGLVVGAKAKILGIGLESKFGVSKQIFKGSTSEGNTYGGDWSLKTSTGKGMFGARGELSFNSGDISVGCNIFAYNVNMNVQKTTNSIVLLDLSSYPTVGGGNLKVIMNIERTIMPPIIDDYKVKVDNTYVAPRN